MPEPAAPDDDVFVDALRNLDHAAQAGAIDAEVVERLRHPRAILQVAVPVRLDDGSLRTFTAWRRRSPPPAPRPTSPPPDPNSVG